MRHVPELHFHYNDSVDKGERIDALLRENPIAEQSPEQSPEAPDGQSPQAPASEDDA